MTLSLTCAVSPVARTTRTNFSSNPRWAITLLIVSQSEWLPSRKEPKRLPRSIVIAADILRSNPGSFVIMIFSSFPLRTDEGVLTCLKPYVNKLGSGSVVCAISIPPGPCFLTYEITCWEQRVYPDQAPGSPAETALRLAKNFTLCTNLQSQRIGLRSFPLRTQEL